MISPAGGAEQGGVLGYHGRKVSGGMFSRVRTQVGRGCFLGKYPAEVFGKVRYGLDTLPVQKPYVEVGGVVWDV